MATIEEHQHFANQSNASARIDESSNAESAAEITAPRVPRVAIVGVHGVGQHAPGSTENAMVDLLLALPVGRPDAARYFDSFRAVCIQIPLQPLEVKAPAQKKQNLKSRLLNLYEEQSSKLARESVKDGRTEPGEMANQFARMLLKDYQGGADGNAYVTTRLEGRRHAAAPGGAVDLHIYEVLWADLASANKTILRFFTALFQLLLHLGSLGRLAVDSGAAQCNGPLWKSYLAMQRYAVRMLQIFLPLFKVMLLIVMFSSVPGVLDRLAIGRSVPVVLCVLAGTVVGFLALTKVVRVLTVSPWIWAAGAFIPGIVGARVGWLVSSAPSQAQIAGSIAAWICLGVPVLGIVLGQYESVRKGVQFTGWLVYIVFLDTYICCLGKYGVAQASFCMVEWVVAAIRASWLLMFAFAFLASVFGGMVWRLERDPDRKARLRAAVRTSRLALALPAVLFLLITSTIWASMFYLAKMARKTSEPFFDVSLFNNPVWGTAWLRNIHLIPDPLSLAKHGDYLRGLLSWSLGYQLPITLALFASGLFLLIWWAMPAALTERFRLRNDQTTPRNSSNTESVRLGRWNSRGLDATSVVTFLIWCSIFLVPPVFYLLPDRFFHCGWMAASKSATAWIVSNIFLVSSGALLAAFVKYGSPVLGAVLDVDTYLRTSPTKATPRAKIVERYISTLRHLVRFRDADGRGYDSVVIVSHSLGALITIDLLRFLYEEGDPDLADFGLAGKRQTPKIPISLLTMGNPARQLLNRFFPFLYDWVRGVPDNGRNPLPTPTTHPPSIAPGMSPRLQELGVSKWVNTYRSGDYVGRSLWLDEWYCRTDPADPPKNDGRFPCPIFKASDGCRVEMCIGAGAHTHYWDDTAPDVSEVLNSLL